MGLLLGGACGNLVDRLVRHHHGAVIDFIDLRWWPVFNVADACITVGALMLVLAGASRRPAARAERAPAGSGTGGPVTAAGGPEDGKRPTGSEGVRGRTSGVGRPQGSSGPEAQPDW
jgi:signal peptidase II